MRDTVTVRIPGSTSNLGSGFDTLGLALSIYSYVRVSRCEGKRVRLCATSNPVNTSKAAALVRDAAALFFRAIAERGVGIEITLSGDVPVGRGLGASAIARVGVLMALDKLTAANLGRDKLLNLATRLEGHPDNASPALFGGFTVSGTIKDEVRCLQFPVSTRLRFVTLIPRFEVRTEEARKLVPRTFSKEDAAHCLNRAALISAALAKGDYPSLRGVFDDRFHQPYRETLIPKLSRVIRAGERAGAIGGWLSGSGSAIICLAAPRPLAVARAMQEVMPQSRVLLLEADNSGARLVNASDAPIRD